MTSIHLALLLISAGLAACRPALEESIIVCRDGGDASCPSGWHCDVDGVCHPGDAPPAVRWLAPSADGAVFERVPLHFEARSLRGLGTATIRVVSPRGIVGTLASEAAVVDEGGTRATYAATWTSWTVEDGVYDVEAVVQPGAPGTPGRATLRVRVANGAPALTITSPPDGALVDGQLDVTASFSSHVPVTDVEVGLQQGATLPAPAAATVSFDDDDHLTGLFAATLDAFALEGGPALVAIHVRDARGHTSTTGIPVIVAHAR